ncbi:hypothetical protein BDZ89DRAFT_451056 [Hymenopellis radicata]|nr:hypothetical protein BDZ89DRAFT_451056 [Hymenopellis radicata]
MPNLPATFTSLYRLALRTSSAAVLHTSYAVKPLRRIWRTPFENAARVIHKLEKNPSPEIKADLQVWLTTWERRGTLALLYNSSQSRGLPHDVTRNLVSMMRFYVSDTSTNRLPSWKPDLAVNAPEYKIQIPKMAPTKRREFEQLSHQLAVGNAFVAMNKVVRMAEGRDGLVLGTAKLQRKVYK